MNTNTGSALEQPTLTTPTPTPPRDRVMRIATMTRQLLHQFHTQPLNTGSPERPSTIDTHLIDVLLTDLAPDARDELQRLAHPLTRHTEVSDAELRLAHVHLVVWLQELLKTTQAALSDPHTFAANDFKTVQTPPNQLDRPHVEPCSPTRPVPGHTSPTKENLGIRSARETLIKAITKRIEQRRLTAAQAAVVLHLTGPRVTQLLQANVDQFTLDELVNLLPALELSLQVVAAAEQDVGSNA